jgi:DNA-binding beta-propeller fold protein YncE
MAIPSVTTTRLMVLAGVVVAMALSTCGGEGKQGDPGAASTPRSPSATPVATSSPTIAEGPLDLEFFAPHGIAVAPDGSIYVADTDRSRVLRVTDRGRIVTFAGEADMHGFRGDGGPAADALLNGPTGLAVDSSAG